MGKSKKHKGRSGGDPVSRGTSLADQMLENKSVRVDQRDKLRQHQDEESVSALRQNVQT